MCEILCLLYICSRLTYFAVPMALHQHLKSREDLILVWCQWNLLQMVSVVLVMKLNFWIVNTMDLPIVRNMMRLELSAQVSTCKMSVWISASTGWDLPLFLSCPGTKNFSCFGVPLSQYKGRSKIPGTCLSTLSPTDVSKTILTFQKARGV